MKRLIAGIFLLMLVIHQDKWAWSSETLVLGFLPAGLAYHALFSVACAVLGWVAIQFAWPHELESRAGEPVDGSEVEVTGTAEKEEAGE